MKDVFLETGNVRAFRQAMATLEDASAGQPGLAVVFGRAGLGKTTCAREYAVRRNALYVRALQDMTPRALMAALCFELDRSEPATTDRGKRTACRLLEGSGRVVLVDEADRLRPALIEHLRDVHDLCGAPVTLIGEESLFPMVNAHRRVWSRVTQTVQFGPASKEDVLLFAHKAAGLRLPAGVVDSLVKRSTGDFRLIWRDVAALERMVRASAKAEVGMEMVQALPDLQYASGRRA